MTVPDDRIVAALEKLGAEHEPPPGWEARVLAAVAPRRPWWRIAMPALSLAAAAALAILVWWRRPAPAPPVPLALVVQGERGAKVRGPMRSDSTEEERMERMVGDVVHIRTSGGSGQRALRIYRNERDLVVRCPGAAGCRVSDGGITFDFKLDRAGEYMILAVASHGAMPELPGTYDEDTAAAIQDSAEWRERRLHVE